MKNTTDHCKPAETNRDHWRPLENTRNQQRLVDTNRDHWRSWRTPQTAYTIVNRQKPYETTGDLQWLLQTCWEHWRSVESIRYQWRSPEATKADQRPLEMFTHYWRSACNNTDHRTPTGDPSSPAGITGDQQSLLLNLETSSDYWMPPETSRDLQKQAEAPWD